MSSCRDLSLIMLVLFTYVEGIFPTVVPSFSHNIIRNNAEKLHLTMLEDYKGIPKVNISKRSAMGFRNFSNYFQGNALSSCRSCGIINSKRKNFLVIQGNLVDPPYKYPWMVGIKISYSTEVGCGGSLINEQYVLTAAHCLVDGALNTGRRLKYFKPRDVFVAFLTQTYKVTPGAAVQRVIPHPGYNGYDHDIALLKLKRRVICDQFKNPICLPTSTFNIKPNEEFTVAGWGNYIYGLQVGSRELRQAKVKFLPSSHCERYFAYFSRIKNNYYCFKGKAGRSPCQGDSGGPVFKQRGGRFILVGVTAMHSDQYCNPNYPFIYTSVPKHLPWINSVIGGRF